MTMGSFNVSFFHSIAVWAILFIKKISILLLYFFADILASSSGSQFILFLFSPCEKTNKGVTANSRAINFHIICLLIFE